MFYTSRGIKLLRHIACLIKRNVCIVVFQFDDAAHIRRGNNSLFDLLLWLK